MGGVWIGRFASSAWVSWRALWSWAGERLWLWGHLFLLWSSPAGVCKAPRDSSFFVGSSHDFVVVGVRAGAQKWPMELAMPPQPNVRSELSLSLCATFRAGKHMDPLCSACRPTMRQVTRSRRSFMNWMAFFLLQL